MAWKDENNSLMPHGRPLSPTEAEAFNLVHLAGRNLVMVPVIVNGEARFALAAITKNEDRLSVQILALVVMKEDRLATVSGQEVHPAAAVPQQVDKKDLN